MTAFNLFTARTKHTFGESFETEHWVNANTGTGLEMGTIALGDGVILDHLSVMADYRIILFPQSILWKRFAIGTKTAAETYFSTGNKSIAFGLEGYWTFSRKIRLETDFMQHILSGSQPANTFRIGFQWMF